MYYTKTRSVLCLLDARLYLKSVESTTGTRSANEIYQEFAVRNVHHYETNAVRYNKTNM